MPDLTSVFEPADDFVVVDEATFAQGLVVMQIRHAIHGHGFSDEGSINVPVTPAPVHCNVSPGRIDGGRELAVPAQRYRLRLQIDLSLEARGVFRARDQAVDVVLR